MRRGLVAGELAGIAHTWCASTPAPIAAGAIWVSVVGLLYSVHVAAIQAAAPGVNTVAQLIHGLPPTGRYVILGALTYLLGSISAQLNELPTAGLRKLPRDAHGNLRRLIRPLWRMAWRLDVSMRPFRLRSQALINVVIASRLSSIDAPTSLSVMIPTEMDDQIRLLAVQLSTADAVQYQEYDRLRAEAELRQSLVIPLFALGITLSVIISWWITLASLLLSAALFRDYLRNQQAANDVLANAVYLQLIRIPLVEDLVTALQSRVDRSDPDVRWMHEAILVFESRLLFDEADSLLGEGLDEFGETLAELIRQDSRSRARRLDPIVERWNHDEMSLERVIHRAVAAEREPFA
jgi:hypothetical protein